MFPTQYTSDRDHDWPTNSQEGRADLAALLDGLLPVFRDNQDAGLRSHLAGAVRELKQPVVPQ